MIFNLIQKRTSVRTFQVKNLAADDLGWVNKIINEVSDETGPNGTQVNFKLLNPDTNGDGSIAGTYGFIKNAQAYIAGTIPNNIKAIEDYGYLLEKIIVKLVEKDIGSCWLGGSFKRTDFANPMELKIGWIIPAVVPIGYPVKNRRNTERAMRFVIKADKRLKWTDIFYNGNFKEGLALSNLKDESATLMSAFESVRLGPSASNRQPWRLVLDNSGNTVHFYLNEDPKYGGNKIGFSMQRIDAGISMYHFQATAEENKFSGKWLDINPGLESPANYKYIKSFSW